MTSLYRDRGPMPKRDAERVRRNEPTVATLKINVAELIGREVEIPTPDPNWHSVALFWYESLAESAQCVYYEPSDWAFAYVIATDLDRKLKPQFVGMQTDTDGSTHPHVAVKPLNGADVTAFTKACSNLLVTEVDRRRIGLEVERAIQLSDLEGLDDEDTGNVSSFEEARAASVGN